MYPSVPLSPSSPSINETRVVTEEIVLMPKDTKILLMLSTNIKDGSIK